MRAAYRGRALRRVLRVLQILSDGRLHGLQELAEQFECSTRTIRRDVEALDEAGIAIEADYLALAGSPAQRTHYQLVNPTAAAPVATLIVRTTIGFEPGQLFRGGAEGQLPGPAHDQASRPLAAARELVAPIR